MNPPSYEPTQPAQARTTGTRPPAYQQPQLPPQNYSYEHEQLLNANYSKESFKRYGTLFFCFMIGINSVDLVLQFLDPDLGSMQLIAIIKEVSSIILYLVGLAAVRTLSLNLLKIFGFLLIVKFLVTSAMILLFLYSNSLKEYAVLVFNNLDESTKRETSAELIERAVKTQEIMGLLFNGVFVGVGIWLVTKYHAILKQLHSLSNNSTSLNKV